MAVKPTPRHAQRRRTRKAIVDAAAALLARGATPSVDDIAAEAEVSRRTLYMYFPTLDQLLIDATVGALTQTSVDHAIEGDDDVEARVERMVRALHGVTPKVERLGRSLVRLTVEGGGQRGYRRVEWIESALSPLRKQISAAKWRRLVGALTMVVGWEALIAQRDVAGLTASEGEELSVWAARALVRATLQDATSRRRP